MIIMLLFLFLMITGIITAVYLKKRTSKWLKFHKLFVLSGLAVSVIGIVFIVFVVQVEIGVHIRTPHAFLGLATFLLTLVTPILGYKYMRRNTDIGKKPLFRKFHKIAGRFSLILLFITIISGLIQFGIIPFS